VLIVLLVLVCVVGFIVLFVVLGAQALGEKGEVERVGERVAAGDASGLAAWSPAILPWLSKDAIGNASASRAFAGPKTTRITVTVPACEGTAMLLALSAESTPRYAKGKIDVLAGGVRLQLVLHGGLWHVTVNGHPFGAIDPVGGHLHDAHRVAVGWYRSADGLITLRGAEVARVDADASVHPHRPAHLRPLLRMAAPSLDADGATWVLAIASLALCLSLFARARERGATNNSVP
jgi:hypothetical protein